MLLSVERKKYGVKKDDDEDLIGDDDDDGEDADALAVSKEENNSLLRHQSHGSKIKKKPKNRSWFSYNNLSGKPGKWEKQKETLTRNDRQKESPEHHQSAPKHSNDHKKADKVGDGSRETPHSYPDPGEFLHNHVLDQVREVMDDNNLDPESLFNYSEQHDEEMPQSKEVPLTPRKPIPLQFLPPTSKPASNPREESKGQKSGSGKKEEILKHLPFASCGEYGSCKDNIGIMRMLQKELTRRKRMLKQALRRLKTSIKDGNNIDTTMQNQAPSQIDLKHLTRNRFQTANPAMGQLPSSPGLRKLPNVIQTPGAMNRIQPPMGQPPFQVFTLDQLLPPPQLLQMPQQQLFQQQLLQPPQMIQYIPVIVQPAAVDPLEIYRSQLPPASTTTSLISGGPRSYNIDIFDQQQFLDDVKSGGGPFPRIPPHFLDILESRKARDHDNYDFDNDWKREVDALEHDFDEDEEDIMREFNL